LCEKIKSFCKKNQVTINSYFLLVWCVFLRTLEEINDIVFGVVTSGRNIDLNEIDNLIGMLVSTLPFRLNISKLNNNLIDYLKIINENMMKINNSNFSLHNLKKKYFKNKEIFNTIFNTIFIFENYGIDESLKKEINLPYKFDMFHNFKKTECPLSISISPKKNSFIINFINKLLKYSNDIKEFFIINTLNIISKKMKNEK